MSCSQCATGSNVSIRGLGSIVVTGSGTATAPFVISLSASGQVGLPYPASYQESSGIVSLISNDQGFITAEILLSEDSTLEIRAAGTESRSYVITMVITQGGTGSNTIDWESSNVMTPGGSLALSTAVGAIDVVELLWTGSVWIAHVVAANVSL